MGGVAGAAMGGVAGFAMGGVAGFAMGGVAGAAMAGSGGEAATTELVTDARGAITESCDGSGIAWLSPEAAL